MGAYDIGPRIGIEGEAEFRRQIREINSEYKTLRTEMQVVKTQFDGQEKSTKSLTEQKKILAKQIELQQQKIKEEIAQLEKYQKTTDISSEKVNKFKQVINTSQAELNKLQAELKGVDDELQKSNSRFSEFQGKMDVVSDKIGNFGNVASTVGSSLTKGLTVPLVAVGAAAVKAFEDVDEGADNVIKATGATGDAAKQLTDVYEDVGSAVKGNLSDIGSVVGEVNTRFEYTGGKLQTASEDFMKFANVTGIDATEGVRLVSRAMGDAGIDADNYSIVLDQLTKAAQASGVSVDKLTENLAKYGAPMRALGFDTAESIALFSQWEKEGVNVEIAFSGMKKAISNWTAEGKDAKAEFGVFVQGIQDGSISSAEAMDVFGAKAGPDLIDAIQGGRFEYQDFLKVIESSEGTLSGTYDELLDESNKAQIQFNKLKIAAAELGEKVINTLGPALEEGVDVISDLLDQFNALSPEAQDMIVKFTLLAAASGPVVSTIGKVSQGFAGISKQLGSEGIISKLGGLAGKFTGVSTAGVAASAATTGLSGSFAALASIAGPVAVVVGAVGIAVGVQKENAQRAALALKDVSEQTDAVKKSNEAVIESIDNTKQRFEDQSVNLEASANQAQVLVSSLLDMVAAEGETAIGKEKIAAMVSTLNNIVPGLNLLYDEQSNALSMTNEELIDNIKNMKEQAKTAAEQELLKQYYIDQANVTKQLADSNSQLSAVQQELSDKEAEQNRIRSESKSLIGHLLESGYPQLGAEISNLKNQQTGLTDQTREMQQKWLDSEKSMGQLSEGIYGTADAYKFVANTSILTKEQLEIYNQSLKNGKSGPEAYQEAINSIDVSMREVAKNSPIRADEIVSGFTNNVGKDQRIENSGKGLASRFMDWVKIQFDSHSPSRKMGLIANDVGLGFIDKINIFDVFGPGQGFVSRFIGGLFSKEPDTQMQGSRIGNKAYSGMASWIESYGSAGFRGGGLFASEIGGQGLNAYTQAIGTAAQGGAGFNKGVDEWTTVKKIREAATAIWKGFCDVLGINSPAESFKWAAQMCLDGFKEKFTPDNWMNLAKQGARSIYDAFSNSNLSVKGLFEALGSNMSGVGAFGDFLRDKLGLDASGLMGSLNQILFPSSGSTGSGTYIGSGGLQWPSDTRDLTSDFGYRDDTGGVGSTYHQGVDIGAPYGSPVYAAGSGSASVAGWYGGYGNAVKLDHGNGLSTLYGHMSEVLTSVGANVRTGETVGLVGSTGNSTGPHIHFSVMVNGEQVDPMSYFGFSVGTRYLPQDMVIQAHEGELILPKNQNPYTNSGGDYLESIVDKVANRLIGGRNGKIEMNTYISSVNPSPSEIQRKQVQTLRKAGLYGA